LLIIPSYIITKISPVKAIRFDWRCVKKS
jgi:hypothetical protein